MDDFSSHDYLKDKLDQYIEDYPKIHLVRTKEREGLIRGRMKGAEKAKGKVLVFLDSHCEVNTDWLQPLLHRINEDPTRVVCPVIDMINPDTLAYKSSPLVRGGFNWGLYFSWEPVSPDSLANPEDHVRPIRCVLDYRQLATWADNQREPVIFREVGGGVSSVCVFAGGERFGGRMEGCGWTRTI